MTGKKLTEKEFINRLPKRIKKDFEIGEYIGMKIKMILINKVSKLKYSSTPQHLIQNKYPSLRTIINRKKYFTYKINGIHKDLKIIKFITLSSKGTVIVEDKYNIKYKVLIEVLLRGSKPNFSSAINKIIYFKKISSDIHNNKFEYSLVKINSVHNKVKIICPTHGIFEQLAMSHLLGKDCKQCSSEKREGGYTLSKWIKSSKTSSDFDSFKIYIIKCWNDKELFYKIGRTFTKTNKRFISTILPYNYEIIEEITGKPKYIFKLEKKLHKKLKTKKYRPNIKFNGYTECFTTYCNIN